MKRSSLKSLGLGAVALLIPCAFGKPPITYDTLKHWPELDAGLDYAYFWPTPDVSADGKYFMFGTSFGRTIEATDGSFIRSYKDSSYYGSEFSGNSHDAILSLDKDRVAVLNLQTRTDQILSDVASFKVSPKTPYIAFADKNHKLTLMNLDSGQQNTFPSVTSYEFSADGKSLFLQTEVKGDAQPNSVLCVDTETGSPKTLYQGDSAPKAFIVSPDGKTVFLQVESKGAAQPDSILSVDSSNGNSKTIYSGDVAPSGLAANKSGTRLLFLVKDDLWTYRSGDEAAKVAISSSMDVISRRGVISSANFASDGSMILFTAGPRPTTPPPPNPKASKLDVWSYQNAALTNTNRGLPAGPWRPSYSFSFNPESGRAIQLTHDFEETGGDDNGYIEVRSVVGEGALYMEGPWRVKSRTKTYDVSIKDGSRQWLFLNLNFRDSHMPTFTTPDHKYFIYFNLDKGDYYSLNLHTGARINLTHAIKQPLYDDKADWASPKGAITNGLKWSDEDKSFYVCDRYDVWKIDPAGTRAPVNVTNGYGRRHHIVFDFVDPYTKGSPFEGTSHSILLRAVNTDNKYNGFYRAHVGSGKDPELLTMGPYIYTLGGRGLHLDEEGYDSPPLKVSGGYIVRRMSAKEAPNFFLTSDFKSYKPLTNIHPENDVNWMTSELIRWKAFDGTRCEGIVYKPTNFDPHKKYPVIFWYYEKFSDTLNSFLRPGLSKGRLNIAYYVSNGYVVCVPDINYKIGDAGPSAYNCVASAAKYLIATRPWVNAKRLGLQGHSFGGFETNFIVTRSGNLFAAACSVSGIADWLGIYGTNSYRDKGMVQFSQSRMGTTPWDDPEVYVRNSPGYFINKIQTPMLLVIGKEDNNVPPDQGIMMFSGLRRLSKPAWMLAYDEDGHEIDNYQTNDAMDFSIRAQGFFDHYLKGAPAPSWMMSNEAP